MKRASFLAGAIGLLSVLSVQAPIATATSRDHKVAICHVPPGNPSNAHTIEIDYHAVPAHLAHGDYPVRCEDIGPEPE